MNYQHRLSFCCLMATIGVVILVAGVSGFATSASAEMAWDDYAQSVEALQADVIAMKRPQQVARATRSEVSSQPAPVQSSASSQNFLKVKPEVELYGQIKMDVVYSDSNAGTGSSSNSQVATYYAPRSTNGLDQNSFNASAQDTRLGLNFKAPDLDNGGKLTGKVEMDFAGGQPSSTYTPRLRLAYVQMDFGQWIVTGGQTWDFFAPINPNILNSSALNRGGNLGTRHPQAYLTYKWGEVLCGKLSTKVGIIDSDDPYQENSGAPVAGAYVSYDTEVMGKALALGVGGIFGTNSTSTLNAEGAKDNNIYAITAGAILTIADWLSLKAEGFYGEKLDDFQGNSATGITNTTSLANSESVHSMGGFVEVTYKPIKALETNYGIGLDYGDDHQAFADRTLNWKSNQTCYVNAKYSLSKDVIVGLEYQYLLTTYMDGLKVDDNRVQSSLLYKF